MNLEELLNDLGDLLQEDFTYSPMWTKAELIGYLRQVVREFSAKTRIVDQQSIEIVDGTTGEASMPSDFNDAYYVRFGDRHTDVVTLGELDFIDADWTAQGTGTSPLGCSIYGSGTEATIRFVPVPSSVLSADDLGSVDTLKLSSAVSDDVWLVTVTSGVLVTTASTGTTTAPVIKSDTKYWDLGINSLGELTTTASASITKTDIDLEDSTDSQIWSLDANDTGELVLNTASYGKICSLQIDGVYQTFEAGSTATTYSHGVIADAFATGVSVTPTHVALKDMPIGMVIHVRQSNGAANVWYKSHVGHMGELVSQSGDLLLAEPYIGIIKHGILAKAYSHENEGQDLDKAKLLGQIFDAECTAVKALFGGR